MTTHTQYAVDGEGLSAFTNHSIMFLLAPAAAAIIVFMRKKEAKHELAFYRSNTGNSCCSARH